MKRRLVYAGLISAVISTGVSGVSFAGPSKGTALLIADSGVQGSESGSSTRAKAPTDKHTDLTGGQQGIPNEYSGTPVRQGKLEKVTDSKWLQKPVYGMRDDIVGEIKQLF